MEERERMKVLQPGIYVRGKKKKKKKGKNVPRPSGYADGCQARREIGTGWKGGMEGLALEDSKELYTRKWQIEVRPTSDTSPFSRRFPQQFFLPASPPPLSRQSSVLGMLGKDLYSPSSKWLEQERYN